MSETPERIWMDPDIKFPECEKQYGCDVEYTRTDHVQALIAEAVAAAYDDAAKVGSSWSDDYFAVNDYNVDYMISKPIRARTPADALAALEARDKRVRDEALREAADKINGMMYLLSIGTPGEGPFTRQDRTRDEVIQQAHDAIFVLIDADDKEP